MNPLSRTLAALASAVDFYGCDGIYLTKLKPGSATAGDVRERLGAPGHSLPNYGLFKGIFSACFDVASSDFRCRPVGASLINMLHPQGASGFTAALLEQVKGDRNAPIALIYRTGNRTTQVQRYLQSQGFTQVYNVKEGMAGSAAGPGWIKRGLPLETCGSPC